MTTVEYLQTPETVLPRELAFGVLRVADAPSISHQRLVRDLTIALTIFARDNDLGEVLPAPMDVILDAERALVVQPDVVFVARQRSAIVTDRIYGAPDLAIEVLSPKPRIGSLEERLGWFALYGVRECWLVDAPNRQIVTLTLNASGIERKRVAGGREPITSVVLPGLLLTPEGLFEFAEG